MECKGTVSFQNGTEGKRSGEKRGGGGKGSGRLRRALQRLDRRRRCLRGRAGGRLAKGATARAAQA